MRACVCVSCRQVQAAGRGIVPVKPAAKPQAAARQPRFSSSTVPISYLLERPSAVRRESTRTWVFTALLPVLKTCARYAAA